MSTITQHHINLLDLPNLGDCQRSDDDKGSCSSELRSGNRRVHSSVVNSCILDSIGAYIVGSSDNNN